MGIPSCRYIRPHAPRDKTEVCLGPADSSCATKWSQPARPGGLPYAVLLYGGHMHTSPLQSIEVCSLRMDRSSCSTLFLVAVSHPRHSIVLFPHCYVLGHGTVLYYGWLEVRAIQHTPSDKNPSLCTPPQMEMNYEHVPALVFIYKNMTEHIFLCTLTLHVYTSLSSVML